jgi:hypothetical protein
MEDRLRYIRIVSGFLSKPLYYVELVEEMK